MSEESAAKPRGGILKWALWGAAAIGVAGVVYIIGQSLTNPEAKPAQQVATGPIPMPPPPSVASKLKQVPGAGAAPDLALTGADGRPVKLADFKGKVVVMNVWATWCGPCVAEMPTLAKLQAAFAGKPVEVVAVSIDTAEDTAKAKAFLARHAPLKFYQDTTMKLPFQLKPAAEGTPVTVIYGKDGKETGRVTGDADWSQPDARAAVEKALSAS
ncbi:MAG TPA: TlpA disulfide reductase family protein [Phenylobacterium sp.]|jgi:thiol-disulfide isomerase/thioredoxin